jgi:hypothetical protein
MSAVETIENLIKLGALVKDAARKNTASGPIDWGAFLKSPEFASIQASVEDLLGKVKEPELDAAVASIEEKQRALLDGNTLAQLSTDKLIQYSDLSDTRLVLTTRMVAVAGSGGFFGWLVNDALPVLVAAGPKVIALLL